MTGNLNPKITVIVPFYKVGNFFEKCLDSIVNQTFSALEILLIDDCSNDTSIDIAKKYAAIDSRIKIIINEQNKGQGYSRNLGIKKAKGKYIAFVDADDWLEPNAYEKLYFEAEKSQCEITNCDFVFVQKDSIYKSDLDSIFNNQKTIYKAIDNPVNYLGKQMVSVWNGLYKKDFLIENNLYFDETKKLEDKLFCWQTRLKAKRICYIPDVLYNYNKTNENQDTKKYSVIYNAYFANILQIKELIDPHKNLHAAFVYYSQKHLYWLLFFTHKKTERKKIKQFFKKEICKNISPDIFKEYNNILDAYTKRRIEQAFYYRNIMYSIKDFLAFIKILIKLQTI